MEGTTYSDCTDISRPVSIPIVTLTCGKCNNVIKIHKFAMDASIDEVIKNLEGENHQLRCRVVELARLVDFWRSKEKES